MLRKTSTDKVSLSMRCGDCVHFQRGPAKFEKPCAQMGVDSKAKAPDCFSPDVFRLNTLSKPEVLGQLGKLLREFTPMQNRILSHLLAKNGNVLHRHGFLFGQPVYFCLGEDYLSHYFKGYVIGACDEYVYVAAKLNKARSNTSLTFMPKTLLTFTDYKKKEKQLLKAKRIFMSDREKKMCKKLPLAEHIDVHGCVTLPEEVVVHYEPPTLDTAPASWFNIYESTIQTKLKKRKPKGKKGSNRIQVKDTTQAVGSLRGRVIKAR